jgi:hypothetical protein
MKRALSGDRLCVLSFLALKSGSPLVARQGHTMRLIHALQPHHLPKIYWVGKTGYAMQRIRESMGPESYRTWDWQTAARSMEVYWYMPENWFYENAPPFNAVSLLNYIEQQGWVKDMELPAVGLLRSLYENELPRLTHGDLTHENTVIEYTRIYKFIDWQAQRHPYIPPHSDVDYGKMLQSLMGWDKDSQLRRNAETEFQIRLLLEERPMAWFWAAVHFMRIKVRAKEDWQRQICDENIDYCSWLGEKKEILA